MIGKYLNKIKNNKKKITYDYTFIIRTDTVFFESYDEKMNLKKLLKDEDKYLNRIDIFRQVCDNQKNFDDIYKKINSVINSNKCMTTWMISNEFHDILKHITINQVMLYNRSAIYKLVEYFDYDNIEIQIKIWKEIMTYPHFTPHWHGEQYMMFFNKINNIQYDDALCFGKFMAIYRNNIQISVT